MNFIEKMSSDIEEQKLKNEIINEDKNQLKELNKIRKPFLSSGKCGKHEEEMKQQIKNLSNDQENETEIERNESYRIIKLSNLTPNETLRMIGKELYLKHKLITSGYKRSVVSDLIKGVDEGTEFEIIACQYNTSTSIVLINKKFYDDVMFNDKDERLKRMYKRIENGWEKSPNEINLDKSFEYIHFSKLYKAFDYIRIENCQKEENVIHHEETNAIKGNEFDEDKCFICDLEIGNETAICKFNCKYHKTCFRFMNCCVCKSSTDDLIEEPVFEFVYCKECFENLKKNPHYQTIYRYQLNREARFLNNHSDDDSDSLEEEDSE